MALKGKVLQEFFISHNKEITNKQSISEHPPTTSKIHSHFRIFDKLEEDKNLGQSSDKPEANLGQKQDNITHAQDKLRTNLGQTSDKAPKNPGQSSDKPKTNLGQKQDNITQTSDKVRSQPRTQLRTNLGQSQDKSNGFISFSSLVGLQRIMTLFIYEQCKLSRDKVTAPLSIEYLANSCETTKLSAQKTLQRLEKKNVILRKEYKNGRGGWTRYELPNLIFQEILHTETNEKLRTNLGQTSDKVRSQPRTQPRTTAPSSSSNEINKITTTTGDGLPSDWLEIDFSELQKRNVFFGRGQLKQVYPFIQHYLSFDVQESIDSFVYDMDNKHIDTANPRFKGYLNLLIGTFRGGALYVSSQYVSLTQTMVNENLQRLKEKQAQKEELRYLQEQEKFMEWLESNRNDVAAKLPDTSWQIAYQHNDREILEWVRKNIYEKQEV